MTSNQIALATQQETVRSNKVREAETYRHNVSTEKETQRANKATEGLRGSELAETKRANMARESFNLRNLAEVNRHNVMTENLTARDITEKERHNRASEGIGYSQIQLGYSQLGETIRSNQARESLQAESDRNSYMWAWLMFRNCRDLIWLERMKRFVRISIAKKFRGDRMKLDLILTNCRNRRILMI